jgi:hypothetical protein
LKETTTPTAASVRPKITNVDRNPEDLGPPLPKSPADLHFELALWARGLESFCSIGQQAFPVETNSAGKSRNYQNEFQITHAALIKCGELIEELSQNSNASNVPLGEDIKAFRSLLSALLISNNAFTRNQTLNFAEWNAWSEIVSERIQRSALYNGFDAECEKLGPEFLPERFMKLIDSAEFSPEDRDDLLRFVPRLGGILRSLEVVRQMLTRDAPVKPTLAIFAFIYETVDELVFEINERLSRRTDETSEMFAMLDASTYTLTIESKKAYSHELAAVIDIRSATAVFSRIESAFGLLNDSIRQLLAGFLRVAEPDVTPTDLFPEFSQKLEQSLVLRADLWSILSASRKAESNASDEAMDALRDELALCLQRSVSYLFYKDRETFERFCNEIAASPSGADAGPILHRFSAFMETLFSQVGMRAVFANHPFTEQ